MLPLVDRVLLALHAAPSNAQRLSTALGADVGALHALLRSLREQGVVVDEVVPRRASLWRLAPGVRLTYKPATVVVEGAVPLRPLPAHGQRCSASTTRGQVCRMPAVVDGRCFLHRPR